MRLLITPNFAGAHAGGGVGGGGSHTAAGIRVGCNRVVISVSSQ